MTTAGRGSDERIRTILEVVPDLLRADRRRSHSLRRITDLARSLFDATYAAAAFVDEDGTLGPMTFSGVAPEVAAGLGPRPVAQDLYEHLRAGSATRRFDLADPTAVALPPGSPPMRHLLGSRLRAGTRTVGLLFVADRRDGEPFDDGDEAIAAGLGETLGAALSNSHLLRDALRARQWTQAATSMTRDLFAKNLDDSLRLISDRARELAGADVVFVILVQENDAVLRHASGPWPAGELRGRTFPLAKTQIIARVINSGRAVLVSDLSVSAVAGLRTVGGIDLGPAMLLPLHSSESVVGTLVVCRQAGAPRFTETDLETAHSFASHVAVTLELAAARATAEKLRLVEDRNRIARDLHDHVVQRLFATGLTLQQAIPHVEGKVRERIEAGVVTLDETIRQIRKTILTLNSEEERTSFEVLISAVARDATPLLGFSPLVALEAPTGELSGELAADLAACIREGVSNAVRHAQATSLQISATVELPDLVLTLEDDGVGIHSDRRSGLDNLAARVEKHGGTLEITTPPGGGTRLAWRVPMPRRVRDD
jgi:signal transduction histidine kinase